MLWVWIGRFSFKVLKQIMFERHAGSPDKLIGEFIKFENLIRQNYQYNLTTTPLPPHSLPVNEYMCLVNLKYWN